MKLEYGNILDMEADAICITTNGFTKSNGDAVMGRGIAKQIADIFPDIPTVLGSCIRNFGNKVSLLGLYSNINLLSFPVKPKSVTYDGNNVVAHATNKYNIGSVVPGFHAKADLDLIEQSALQLVAICNHTPWKRIILPYPGCGAGELLWSDVKPTLESILDDRFVAVTFNKE